MAMNPRLLRPGGGTVKDPQGINNLSLWLDAADASTLAQNDNGTTASGVGEQVGYWADKSGNGYHATQGTSNNRPTRVTFAGRHALDFDGSNDRLENFTFPALGTGNFTWFQVVTPDAVSAFRTPAQLGRGANLGAFPENSRALISATDGIAQDGSIRYGRLGNDFFITTAPVVSTSVANSLVFRRGSVSLSSAKVNRQNTTPPTADPASMDIIQGFRVGSVRAVLLGDIQFWDGKICELILYNRALSNAEIVAVERYLAAKWLIS